MLLSNDGVRERIGEADGGHIMECGGTECGTPVFLCQPTIQRASQWQIRAGRSARRLTSLREVEVLGVGLELLTRSKLLFPIPVAPNSAPKPRTLFLLLLLAAP